MTPSRPATLSIRNARVLLPDGSFQSADVWVEGGVIREIGPNLDRFRKAEASAQAEATPTPTADTVIDAHQLTLLPGVIDPQVHFREPGLEHKEDLTTASRACARGGVTSFLEMPNTKPLTINQAALNDKLTRAAQKSFVNFGFFIGATSENLPDLQTATPTPGIKIFMGSMHGDLLVDQESALDRIFATGTRLIAVHAEDQALIAQRRKEFAGSTDPAIHSVIQDNQAALNATQLALKLSKKYQRRLHILHLSTAEEAELLRQDKPAWVTAEVTPQHLLLNTGDYQKLGSLIQMNPPIRSTHEELQTKCGWSPFEGWNLTGWPAVTIVGGQVVYDRGQFNQQVRGRALTFNA